MGTPAPGAVPAPVAASLPTPAPGAIAAPGGLPGAIAAPPFAQPQAAPAAAPAPAAAKPAGGDPFAAASPAAVGERKVTLVIDDSAVNQADIGRQSNRSSMIAFVLGAGLGCVIAGAFMSTSNERQQYNMAVRDGKEIYAKVQEVSKVLDSAKGHVKAAVAAAQATPGKTSAVAYPSIEAVVALERPFTANEFHRRRYLAFPSNVVDDLFDYYNNMNLLWDRFAVLGAKTAGTKKREALDASAKAADGLIKTQYGIVLMKKEEQFSSAIVYLQPSPPDPENPPEEGAAPKLKVSSAPGGRQVDRTLFMGQEDFVENTGNYVFLVDKMRSRSVLGEPANLFSAYTGQLMEVFGILNKNAEVQGRLMKEMGKVASLEERNFF